ncbi:MAG: amidase family protein [Actinomycetota bacterium]|nr:amidase family protein [Actinomycetota bacterium]
MDAFTDATAQAGAVRTGRTTSRKLVEQALDRIERYDGRLHALVTVDADGARTAADAADAAVRDGARTGPLHGVPVTLKDAWATAGLRTTTGSAEQATVPDGDAAVVAALRAAGAVVVGKTSVPPGITGQETANDLVGRACNPWDLTRTTGGSSGGAAAAVATGLVALDVGSDLGGSVRQPAHCCGVFGHAASHGLLPMRGHLPRLPLDVESDVDLLTAGPLTRSADDLALALRVLARDAPDRGGPWRRDLPAPAGPLRGLRVAAWLDDPVCPVTPEVGEVLAETVERLRGAGVTVDEQARPVDLAEAREITFSLWVAASSYSSDDEQLEHLAAEARGYAADDLSFPALRARAEAMGHRDWLRLDERRARLLNGWREFFRSYDVLLCPAQPWTAVPHDPEPEQVPSVDRRLERTVTTATGERPYLDMLTWMVLVTGVGLPGTVAPVGVASDGLPVGLQVVGAHGHDLTTISVAGEIASLAGGWRRPPGF